MITGETAQNGRPTTAGEKKSEAYPLGYVEDFFEPRTKLEAFFSSLKRAQAAIPLLS